MENKSFIKVFRKMLEWEWYDDKNTKILFLHLLLIVNWTDKKWHGITIEKGTILTGRKKLAEETGLTEQQVRFSLTKLKKTNEITIKTTNSYSIIGLNNWREYQGEVANEIADEQPTSSQQVATTKEGNKGISNNSKVTSESVSLVDSELLLKNNLDKNEIEIQKEDKKRIKREDTIRVIDTIQNFCKENSMSFSSLEAFKYSRLIVTGKEFNRCAEMCGMSREDYCISILKASIAIKFWKGPCCGPKDIYLNHSEVYNKALFHKQWQGSRGTENHEAF